MLRCEELEAAYGPVVALQGISLSVAQGEVVTLIGANGAGKSTTLKAIVGLVPPSRGRISLSAERIDGLPPEAVARRGVALVPEGRRIFPGLTVQENLEVGASAWDARRAERLAEMEKVFSLFPRLAERRQREALRALEEVKRHPFVAEALKHFPGAEVVGVRQGPGAGGDVVVLRDPGAIKAAKPPGERKKDADR